MRRKSMKSMSSPGINNFIYSKLMSVGFFTRRKSKNRPKKKSRLKFGNECERALREMEKAEKHAATEAKKYAALAEKARKEAQNDERVADRKGLLDEALANQERVISRAQMTRSGHVYAISNTGSFGENVYKAGMSRRLEPMDRVRELGDASAPFPFDVHVMIFTDDAPGLESATHRRIESNRLNSVNLRREFFVITPEPWLRKSRLLLLILV